MEAGQKKPFKTFLHIFLLFFIIIFKAQLTRIRSYQDEGLKFRGGARVGGSGGGGGGRRSRLMPGKLRTHGFIYAVRWAVKTFIYLICEFV